MKQFDEWFKEYGSGFKGKMAAGEYINRNAITIEFFEGVTEDAFRAGMLAAADIAERMYFHHTPDDGVISGEGIAAEIRKRAE